MGFEFGDLKYCKSGFHYELEIKKNEVSDNFDGFVDDCFR